MPRVSKVAWVMAASFVAMTAGGCNAPNNNKAAQATPAANADAEKPKLVAAAQSTATPARHEYVSRDGNVFYYPSDDGTLVGTLDHGRAPQDQDMYGNIRKGDRFVQFDHRQFAAVTPGSEVVRVYELPPERQVFRLLANVPLSGDSAAAKALRDSLAGLLTFPSEAQLDAKATEAPSAPQVVKASSASQASADPQATAYEGYVPEGIKAEGQTYPGQTAAQILRCTAKGLKASDLHLSPEATHSWFALCAKANPVNTQFVANSCASNPSAPACQAPIASDAAIRKGDGFWQIVNAMAGRPDDFGLD